MDEVAITAKAVEEFMKHNPLLSYATFTIAGVFGWVARVVFAQGRKHWLKEFFGFFLVGVPISAFSGVMAFQYIIEKSANVPVVLGITAAAIYAGSTLSMNIAIWLYDLKIKDISDKAINKVLK